MPSSTTSNMPRCTSNDNLRSSLKKSTCAASSSESRCVRFDKLEIIEFPQIMGDNPACRTGVPLTLDWTPVEQSTLLIDYYEHARGPRRTKKELHENKHDRLDYLYTNGYTDEHIELVKGDIWRIKQRRKESRKDKESFLKAPLKAMNSAIKTVTKKPNKLLRLPSKSIPPPARTA